MKTLSVLGFILGQWALDFDRHEGKYIAYDVLLGFGCWALSFVFWLFGGRRD